MKKVPIMSLIKLQICILTIVMIFCRINHMKLSISFYTYYFASLAVVTFSAIISTSNSNQEDNHFQNNHINNSRNGH
jgi:hypothetical protein